MPIPSEYKTICDDCIHREICSGEGHFDPAMTFCVDKVSDDVLNFVKNNTDNRPLLFTISHCSDYTSGYYVKTTDERITDFDNNTVHFADLFEVMEYVSERYGNQGFSVIFEVG